MKKSSRVILIAALSLVAVLVIGIASFFLLIVAGLSPSLQSTWICTAMTTYKTKFLATAFFSDEYIAEVMEANQTDDTGYESSIIEIKKPEPVVESDIPEVEEEKIDPYVEEGYTLLEEGLYVKEISGTTWSSGVPTIWKGKILLTVDPSRVKLVDTKNQWSCGQKVEMMMENVGAIAGINGGGFADGVNYDSNGGTPIGIIIEDGNLVCPTNPDLGYTYPMIGINADGALILRHTTARWALDNNIQSAVSALTFLIVDGEGIISANGGSWGIAPRTAIGQRETGEMLMLTVDGRQPTWSVGVDLDVLEEIMLEEKAYNAAMLDGGTSTVMLYRGEFLNKPSNGEGRYINNCFVVMPIDSGTSTGTDGE